MERTSSVAISFRTYATAFFDNPEASPTVAFNVKDYFRVTTEQARKDASRMLHALKHWAKTARQEGISEASIARMSGNFERGLDMLKKAV